MIPSIQEARMRSAPTFRIAAVVLLAALVAGPLRAQNADTTSSANRPATAQDAELIASALSAAPASIGEIATVRSFDGRVLREGPSEWVCMPDMPQVPNNTPVCLDAPWQAMMGALMQKQTPHVTKMGFGYMLQGDMPASNTDPFATGPTPTNQWIQHGPPHIMVLVPDPSVLDSLPTDPEKGGPYVMWKGTPYAHIMVPTLPPGK
jgi:hypothetical protein